MTKRQRNRMLRKMGFKTDQNGIVNRYLREEGAWNTHLDNTKQFICRTIANIEKRQSVAVLGSGWLFDVPVEELSREFENVVLIDIIQPKQIKHKTARYGNVTLVEADITGGVIEKAYRLAKNSRKQQRKIPLCNIFPNPDENQIEYEKQLLLLSGSFDYVISVNLLNQLNILIVDYLKTLGMYNQNELLALSKAIQKHHLQILPEGKTCLITDFEEVITNTKTNQTQKRPLVFVDLPESRHKQYWTWHFDTKQTYYAHHTTTFRVVAQNF